MSKQNIKRFLGTRFHVSKHGERELRKHQLNPIKAMQRLTVELAKNDDRGGVYVESNGKLWRKNKHVSPEELFNQLEK
jgi:hypothetical protein